MPWLDNNRPVCLWCGQTRQTRLFVGFLPFRQLQEQVHVHQTAITPAIARPALAGRLPARAAFYLQASIVVLFLAGSSAPTPLYSVYQDEWGFSPITVTVVFGIYALAVLGALLTVGSLSDHVGRRPVLLVAIALQAVALLVFATAGGVPALLLARVVQGLSTGLGIGAVGAGMLDLDRAKGRSPTPSGP
jgi:MFS family permease